ncbi:site-specific integrase [Chitinophaga sancti]|uniref:Uncharacterized protein n=1 Tax=Chitinophaga sancti TaxID=1004 RepID=A0A1K1T4G1_9BACT|nr:hypothetical protein [Chitinophaga sancti]WQD65358.1 hypothetical protein U0033_13235 [Chitinophaga sancti]WQG89018.1 hypothetical protein SR876_29235 [Chitinophaga sancti]SFW91464.1 hypothetical protein SAMN05661012_06784 [Chitinophaga sancti]
MSKSRYEIYEMIIINTDYEINSNLNTLPDNKVSLYFITGSWWIIQDRTKTKWKADIPLFRDAQSIIEKYANHECLKKGVLLPVVANANYNLYLKEIAAGARIVKRLTTHTAPPHFCVLMS